MRILSTRLVSALLIGVLAIGAGFGSSITEMDRDSIETAADTQAIVQGDVVRIGWSRDDVKVVVDGMPFPPAAGLGSWAAFKRTGAGQDAIVMGDTVVFQDEVDAAMDVAFSRGLEVTALHNHFFYDEPKVYFMHIGGHGPVTELAGAVKAIWNAIKSVRAAIPEPAKGFTGRSPESHGSINAERIKDVTRLDATTGSGGVVKVASGRNAWIHDAEIGGGMGLTSWAAFSGDDTLAVMDGDFIMTAAEVQPVLKSLRKANLHIVALHNHMIGEQPAYFFTHFWGKGTAVDLAQGFRSALDAQEDVKLEK